MTSDPLLDFRIIIDNGNTAENSIELAASRNMMFQRINCRADTIAGFRRTYIQSIGTTSKLTRINVA